MYIYICIYIYRYMVWLQGSTADWDRVNRMPALPAPGLLVDERYMRKKITAWNRSYHERIIVVFIHACICMYVSYVCVCMCLMCISTCVIRANTSRDMHMHSHFIQLQRSKLLERVSCLLVSLQENLCKSTSKKLYIYSYIYIRVSFVHRHMHNHECAM